MLDNSEWEILDVGELTDEMRARFRDSSTEPILIQHEILELTQANKGKKRLMVLTTEYLYVCSANKNTTFAIGDLQAMIKSTTSSEVVIVG